MDHRIIRLIIVLAIFMLNTFNLFAQSISIDAGSNQIINWEKTHSTQLKGSVSSTNIKTEWTCPQNKEVVFKDASSLMTEVTFPRPGYYLLQLSAKKSTKEIAGSSVIVNVFRPTSYKERLSDLISLMTVEEKIKQLVNEAASIPRLGLSAYNYWSEALHGVLASGATSFPQAIAMGSTWDPDLVFQVGTVISDEARALNITSGKGLMLEV